MKVFVLLVCLALCLTAAGCSGQTEDGGTKADPEGSESEVTSGSAGDYTLNTKVTDVMNDPVFGDYGRLIFPVDRIISEDLELQDVGDILVWYNNVNPDRTVEIANYLKDQAASGEQIFYDIYTDEEKAEDPEKEDTGLFFFRGDPGAKTAIVNAGGGFAYVAAMHDSFPHALELSKMGYNAFALIYRPGAQTACEDLARAIACLHENAEELQIDVSDYSLWGGSAGARMAGLLWDGGFRGGCISGSWGSDHAVYRAVRGDRKRASHLRLCGNQGWDRFIPVHGKLYQPDTGRWNGCPDRGV